MNIEGYVQSVLNKDILDQTNLIRVYSIKAIALINELMLSYDSLKGSLMTSSDELSRIGKLHADLKSLSYKFSDPVSVTDNFEAMNKISLEWSSVFKLQMEMFDIEFKQFFLFYIEDLNYFCKQAEGFSKLKEAYMKYFVYLTNKKEKLYRNSTIDKWEIDSKILKTLDPDTAKVS